MKKSTWFSSSKEQKYEDSAELLEKAANAFKVAGCNNEAGNAYVKAAELYRDELKNIVEACKCLTSGGTYFFFHSPRNWIASITSKNQRKDVSALYKVSFNFF